MKKFAFVFLLLLIVSSVYAFKVSPARLDLTINRGKTMDIALTLTGSKGVGNEHLLVYPTDLWMSRTGTLLFEKKDGKNSAVSWIKLDEEKLSLLEGQARSLKFKISVPLQAAPGEYYAVVMVEPTEFSDVKAKDKPFMMHMKSRVAVVIIIDVPGRVYEKKGEAMSSEVKEVDGKLKVLSTFNNAGDIHLDVIGVATVRSKTGASFGQFKLVATGSSKEEAFVFPGTMRDFEAVIDRPLPKGEYFVDVSYDYGYKFNKAKLTSPFSVSVPANIDETKSQFLLVKTETTLQIPVGASRTHVLEVSNKDYRPINVSVQSDAWVNVTPADFSLAPGEVRKMQVVFSVSDKGPKTTSIIFKADRGLPSTAKFSITTDITPKKKEK